MMNMNLFDCNTDVGVLLKALKFSAGKHRDQRRKGGIHPPYINHPIEVTEALWRIGGVRDTSVLVAALLHDTIEDTDTRPEEIAEQFGEQVLRLVLEVTDDKSLPKEERKRLQVVNAPHKSDGAAQIKLADKISNVAEITSDPPENWSIERQLAYFDWTEQVVNGLPNKIPALEARYREVLAEARKRLAKND